MGPLHPRLPEHRPLAIAHRAGNDIAFAQRAFALGCDMVETDVWKYRKRLELRHLKTMGPIPLLWDRWTLRPGWTDRLVLRDMLAATPLDKLLFLDLKGKNRHLAHAIVEDIQTHQPDRQIVLCGRTWPQLDEIVGEPHVTVFYSVGSDEELATVWSRLEKMEFPAVSIHSRYLNDELMRRFKDLGTTVVTWAVNEYEHALSLWEIGVDGFTSDNLDMLAHIAEDRDEALRQGPRVAPEGVAPPPTSR